VAVDGTNVYIADPGNHVIRKVAIAGGAVSVFAGTAGTPGFLGDNGAATSARLNRPGGVAVGSDGEVFIADTNNHRIRKVAGATITSVVSTGIVRSGFEGDGGPAGTARLNSPSALAFDAAGNMYIVDKGNNRIRLVNASDNRINTVAGNGLVGFSGDGGPATQAKLGLANSVAVGSQGMFIADTGNNRIRLASAAPNSAPSLTSPGNQTVDEGQTLSFTLQATDPNAGQTLSYSMSGAPAGATLNLATGAFSYSPGFDVVPNNAGATQLFTVTFTATDNAAQPLSDSKPITITVNNVNRPPIVDSGAIPPAIEATSPNGAQFQLNGTATDPDGDQIASIVWTDTQPGQEPLTIATQLSQSVMLALGQHSIVLTASDNQPNGAASSPAKNVTVQDTTPPVFSNLPADITQTITSGSGANVTFNLPAATDAVSGNRTVIANPASGSFFPIGMTTVTFTATDAAGNTGTATFKVTVVCNGAGCGGSGGAMNFNLAAFAGNGSFGSTGDGSTAVSATFKQPHGVAVGANGDVYLSDAEARVIRRVNAQGVISLFAGTGAKGFAGDGGAASSAKFNNPAGLAFDAPRNLLYVADTNNHRIRRIDLANNTITTFAGNGIAALGAAGAATSAALNRPMGVAVDALGAVYLADTGNNRVCKVVNGQLTIIAGTGEIGNSGDGASATAARLNHPAGVAVSSDGANVYVADTGNHRVRSVSGGNINAFAGTGTGGFGGDGGAATAANLSAPADVAVDADGNVYLADTDNERIRKVSASDGKIATIAGNGNGGNTGDGGAATGATMDTPRGIARDVNGTVYFADAGNLRVRKLTMGGPANNPPVPAQVANQSLNKNQTLEVALSATDADNDPVTFAVVPALSFVSIINANPAGRSATMRINPAGGNAGVYNAQVQAADDKGGTGLTPPFTITVTDPNGPLNRPPVAIASPLPSNVVAQNGLNATVALDGTGSSDPDGDPLTYSWTDNGQVIATTATANAQLAIGQHSIVLTVSDGRGGTNRAAAQTVVVTAPSNELAIDTVSPNSGKRGQSVTVTITGTGFTSQSVVTVNGGGVTVTVTQANSTQITATFAISSNTQASTRSVTVTNPGVASVTQSSAFTIRP
jgi:YD repeat-containing protein